MKQILGSDWEITPAGGQTGEAYVAQSGDQKLFLKRNSSPFLAVLSAEGIVPKLLWTKRMENGDVITAQRWLKGRELSSTEMQSGEVADLLRRIHTSGALLAMLRRLGKKALTPHFMLQEIKGSSLPEFQHSQPVQEAVGFLSRYVDHIQLAQKVVCHCDINHNNWLLGDDNDLYLIDWDNAMIADPAVDLGMLLYFYVDPSDWRKWLASYGLQLTEELRLRMHWYVAAQTILFMLWHHRRKEDKEKDQLMYQLIRVTRWNEQFL